MKKLLLFVAAFIAVVQMHGQLRLELHSDGYDRPVDIVHDGVSPGLYIVEQTGKIIYYEQGEKTESIDLGNLITTRGNEQGLLGLAFHPNYENNGRAFVYYTDPSDDIVIASLDRANAMNSLDVTSLEVILRYSQPFRNHNGGCLRFGPDGYLYVGTGDGGSRDDPGNRAQNLMDPLGKMLRIDIDNGSPYAIPADNPFADDDFALDEIWAYGLRNPWRFSFDKETGDLWIGDVGQDAREEIDRQLGDSQGGENYGWRCKEGVNPYITEDCSLESLVDPYFDYPHQGNGCSVTGGLVSYSKKADEVFRKYVYGDICSSNIWSIDFSGAEPVNEFILETPGGGPSTFGTDVEDRFYTAVLVSGSIYELVGSEVVSTTEPGIDGSHIYPSVAQNVIHVELSTGHSSTINYAISDLQGKQILDGTLRNKSIDVSHIPAGSYVLILKDGVGTSTHKFIKSL